MKSFSKPSLTRHLRVAFMGSDPIALPFLRAAQAQMSGQMQWVLVFTQPDRRTGRGLKTQPNEIKVWAQEAGIPVRQPEKCGDADVDALRKARVDVVIVMAYGQILRRALLESVPLGVLNFHGSLLPQLRGASPIQTALAEGFTETGISLMRLVPKMDAGPVADREIVPITAETDHFSLREALGGACVALWARAIQALCGPGLRFLEQDQTAVTYCRRLRKEDAYLDFRLPATVLERRIRAFRPWPGALVRHQGLDLRVGGARVLDGDGGQSPGEPGTVEITGGAPTIACSRGWLRLESLQRPGGRLLPAADFLRGYPIEEGSRLEMLEAMPLVGKEPFGWTA
ncbi:MAG: methionyl-tRNA formyltransferase [Opitutales bacterium]|nr:methionyl-tRNA formyltransferase [Opitutales bacterium]